MRTLLRRLRALRMLPPALAIAAPGVGPRLARSRFPKVDGALEVRGLGAPVRVIRDRWGVPHLYAEDERDLVFAQGYVHAQDRLWQLELSRRIGQGTLSAMVGEAGLPIDRFTRTLGLRRLAERAAAELSGDARALLEAYAAGVNARIEGGEPLPYEFTLLGVTPAPWTPADTLLRGNLLALALSGNYRIELLRARLVAEVGEDVAAQLLTPHAPDTPLIVRGARRVEGMQGVTSMEGLDGVDRWLGDPNIVSGSNNWVVHGSRTASGKPLLCNDIHIGLALPSTWYGNGLHGGRLDVVGFSLPGIPLVVLGHNGRVAWGMSNLGPDTQDFYVEKLDDPRAPRRYEVRGEWRDLEITREEIPVRGGDPVALEIRCTGHGPIMNEAMSRLLEGAEPLSLRWTLRDCAPLVPALLGLNLAASCAEVRSALAGWEMPGQNFVFADVEGNIAYQATGKIPIRAPGHDGLAPVPGWTGDLEWQGFIPFEELPRALNPEDGFVVTANNKITADDYPYLIAHHWFPGYRARRITDLLAAGDRHTVDDMRRVQADVYSLPAEALRPHLLAVAPEGDLQARALDAVRAWDLCYEVDRAGATIFQAWYICLLRALLRRKLSPDLAQRYLASDYERHGSMHVPMVIALLSDPESDWFDAPPASRREVRDELVRRSFADAVAWLSSEHGPDPASWRWGRAHTMTLMHSPLGRSGPGFLRRLFNSRTMPARGDNYTVDGASFLWSDPFKVVHGTTLRMIVDLGDVSRSIGIHTPGQTEHLHHPHRDDLMAMCQQGEYHPLLFTREAVLAHAEATLTLLPAGAG